MCPSTRYLAYTTKTETGFVYQMSLGSLLTSYLYNVDRVRGAVRASSYFGEYLYKSVLLYLYSAVFILLVTSSYLVLQYRTVTLREVNS